MYFSGTKDTEKSKIMLQRIVKGLAVSTFNLVTMDL